MRKGKGKSTLPRHAAPAAQFMFVRKTPYPRRLAIEDARIVHKAVRARLAGLGDWPKDAIPREQVIVMEMRIRDAANKQRSIAKAFLTYRPNDGQSGRCGVRISGDAWCVLDHGHEGDHV